MFRMKFTNSFYKKCIGQSTILYGESNTGKTFYTAGFVKLLVESQHSNPEKITILDFAPKMEIISDQKIGGKVSDYYIGSKDCKYYSLEKHIIPPRLNAESRGELYDNLCHNFRICHGLLEIFNENPTPFLIINDVSIYLHLSKVKTLGEYIQKANTFFGNSYYGISISRNFSKGLSRLEQKRVFRLKNNMDRAYHLKEKFETP